ncbi:MAG TPA: NF038122 family metalloprotease, partial [Blastocatellia bacterium]|nr:NF038122 family metalloprotease [Blastocatellia bacterium]
MMKLFASDRRSRFVVSLILFLALFVFLSPRHPRAQDSPLTGAKIHRYQSSADSPSAAGEEDGYVIVNTPDGVTCRQVTREEAAQLSFGKARTDLRPLPENRLNAQQQQGLKITLRSTSQLDQFPQAKQVFQRAAARWESIIQSPITVVIDVDFGPTIFGTPFPASNIIGATDPQRLGVADSYAPLRATLIARAQNAQQAEIFNLLPAGNLPTDLGTSTNFSAPSSVLRAVGGLPAVANPDAELSQIGPPPSMGFNSAFTFDFDASDGIDADKTDFEAVAIHEIGHALGFITGVGGKESNPSSLLAPAVWDLFRFRPGGLVKSAIGTAARVQLAGGEHVFFTGEAELPLSTSTNAGTNGDGRQGSHWKDNALIGTFTGVMDPTASSGERLPITAADLTALGFFGYRINPASTIAEVLSVDDGSREEALTLTNALVVNRYTPARYPAQLEAVRVQIPPTTDGTNPVGQQLRIIAFVDANRTGQPPANPTLIVDRTITIPSIPASRFIETVLSSPPTINAGDIYVGIQSASASVLIAGDRTGRQFNRSFVSTNNGASFQPLQNATNAPLNFISRIVLNESFNSTPAPAADLLSPSALPPGSAAFTLVVQGSNFQPGSVVRWNNSDRPTTLLSGTQLQAQIPATDVVNAGTANVTVFTQGAAESVRLPFTIAANRPLPSVARISPNAQATGATAPLTLNVFGANFTAQSV